MFLLNNTKSFIGVHVDVGCISLIERQIKSGRDAVLWKQVLRDEGLNGQHESQLPDKEQIDQAARLVTDRVGGRYVAVNVAVADPLVVKRIITLEKDIGKKDELMKFLLWKLQQEHYIDMSNKKCTYQRFADKDKKIKYFVEACDSRLINNINEAFIGKGVAINTLDSSYAYIHNRLKTQHLKSECGIILMKDDYWTLALVSQDMVPLLVKSYRFYLDWSDVDARNSHYKYIGRQIERHLHWLSLAGMDSESQSIPLFVCGLLDEEGQSTLEGYLSTEIQRIGNGVSSGRVGIAHGRGYENSYEELIAS